MKNRGRAVIQDLEGFTWVGEMRDMPVETLKKQIPGSNSKSESEAKEHTPSKHQELLEKRCPGGYGTWR